MSEPDGAGRAAAYLRGFSELTGHIDPAEMAACATLLTGAWRADRTVFLIGNGGSAATATHMACDLSMRTRSPDGRALRALSLTDNVALITALANDHGYDRVFAGQIEIHGRPGDVLLCISCSGNSPSILAAIGAARERGLTVIGLGGFDGGALRGLTDVYVHAPSDDFGVAESAHLLIEHWLADALADTIARPRPVVFIDRDGVLIRNREDHVRTWDQVEILPRTLEALAMLHRAGHRVLVVSNQSVVGRGLVSREAVDAINSRLAAVVAAAGGEIVRFLVCPHAPDAGCACRKPLPGLLLEARDTCDVDLNGAVLVGDHMTDVAAARAAGVTPILVLSGRTAMAPESEPGLLTVPSLVEAVRLILSS